jgi:prolyl-tRNA synthetase
MDFVEQLARELRDLYYHQSHVRVEVDDRDIGGARGWEWIKKGIPVRIEVGPRDIADKAVFVGRRDKDHRDKVSMSKDQFVKQLTTILDEIQNTLLQRALTFREKHTFKIDTKGDFYTFFTPQDLSQPEIHGGFALSPWCGSATCETQIKDDLSVTIRCLPFEGTDEPGACVCCGQPSDQRVVFAKAY